MSKCPIGGVVRLLHFPELIEHARATPIQQPGVPRTFRFDVVQTPDCIVEAPRCGKSGGQGNGKFKTEFDQRFLIHFFVRFLGKLQGARNITIGDGTHRQDGAKQRDVAYRRRRVAQSIERDLHRTAFETSSVIKNLRKLYVRQG
jgi:hypothetical protein